MITIPTAIVLGAGASCEFGFPSGQSLRTALELPHAAGDQLAGPRKCLVDCGFAREDVDRLSHAMRFSGSQTVDALLEGRDDLLAIGKAAIAAGLIPFENRFDLFKNDSLYRLLFERMKCGPGSFGKNQVTFITLNYDRSLEEFLHCALMNAYDLTNEAAARAVAPISINHLHGSLGEHPAFGDRRPRPYETTVNREILDLAAAGIRVIHEPDDESVGFFTARITLQNVARVIFLGVGYDRRTLDRLNVRGIPHGTAVYGTAYKLGAQGRTAVRDAFGSVDIKLGAEDETARDFLREHVQLT